MKKIIFIFLLFSFACTQEKTKTVYASWSPYDETEELAKNAEHESKRMRFKLIQSRISDKNALLKSITEQIPYFSEEDYQTLKPLIFDQNIPTLQAHIKSGKLSYEALTQWYLYRIVKYENQQDQYLNNIISINPDAVIAARKRDQNKTTNDHPIYGMPVLLKDNINFEKMATTAGTHFLKENIASNAFIVDRIIEKGGIILGKTNLSEWANFLCIGCPNGYSAVGGQTLNPYGRKEIDTGGSSSGSGSSIAANYAVAAVGTETSGSILSPSSAHSLVGLKPTTGLLSRSGIVPLSNTLDTPGPMTKNVIDNAIFTSAMTGEDTADSATKDNPKNIKYWEDLISGTLEGIKFGVNKNFLEDSIYQLTVEKIKSLGGITIEFEPEDVPFEGFIDLLNADMKIDLPQYLDQYANKTNKLRSIEEIVAYNEIDSLEKIPYGQGQFKKILETNLNEEELKDLKTNLKEIVVRFFENPIIINDLDFILSINNWNAGHAALANYPCITVPMGYRLSGEPVGLTFISRPYQEDRLLKVGHAFEKANQIRKSPKNYQ